MPCCSLAPSASAPPPLLLLLLLLLLPSALFTAFGPSAAFSASARSIIRFSSSISTLWWSLSGSCTSPLTQCDRRFSSCPQQMPPKKQIVARRFARASLCPASSKPPCDLKKISTNET
jgi:hypothetical protein